MRNPLKLIRRGTQLLALGVFLWLFAQARWHGVGTEAPAPLFLQMDPLAAAVALLAPTPTWQPLFYPALVVLIVTLLLGRVFCGWVCPLGTTLDICDHLLFRSRQRRPVHLSRPAWKFYVLGGVLVAALFGTQLAWLMDPIPLLTRTLTVVVYPIVVGAYNAGVIFGRPLLQALGLRLHPAATTPAFALNIPVLLVFVIIVGLSLLARRYWCRTLCPLGALLAVIGRCGLLQRRVTGCVKCRRCESDCKMGAIPRPADASADWRVTLAAECIQCYDCLVCPQQGISRITLRPPAWGLRSRREAAGDAEQRMPDLDRRLQLSKRYLLGALGLGALYALTASTGAGRRPIHGRLIRPPGAIIRTPEGIRNMTEREFRDLCIRCGSCMKACVTGGLQPAVVEAGFDGVFTPILVPRIGHCEQLCTACGEVCPTGALGRFRVEEKKSIKLGLATIHTDKCLAWRKGKLYKLCLVCKEHCGYGAIDLIMYEGEQRPVVNASLCVGCGECERACPVKPEAAIVVYRDESAAGEAAGAEPPGVASPRGGIGRGPSPQKGHRSRRRTAQ